MATPKQQRAQALARSRGFRTVYQMRQFEAANKRIGGAKAPTITRGLEQAKDTVRQNRVQQRDVLLAKFGLTISDYHRRDRENREWFDKELARRSKLESADGSTPLVEAFLRSAGYHTYREDIADSVQWTEAKVGYVASFWAANVSRRTGYGSLFSDPLNPRRKRGWGQEERKTVGGFDEMNAAQYFYLTQYTDLMTVNEYEVSYGSQQRRDEASTPVALAVA